MRNAARSYQESWNRSADPFVGLVRNVAGGAADAGGRLFDGLFGRPGNGGGGPGNGAAAPTATTAS